jgi:hypothetical protein
LKKIYLVIINSHARRHFLLGGNDKSGHFQINPSYNPTITRGPEISSLQNERGGKEEEI